MSHKRDFLSLPHSWKMALPAHLHAYSFLKTWEVITSPWHFRLYLVLIFCKQVSLMSFEKAFHRSWNTMASKYMKRCLTSLVANKCKFRPQQDTTSLIILARVKRMKASYVVEKERGACPPSDIWLDIKRYNFWKDDVEYLTT